MINHPNRSQKAQVRQSSPNSEFSLLWHRDGQPVKLIAGNLSATEAQHRLEALSELAGQPILRDLIVNDSGEENCGYHYVVEDLAVSDD